MRKVDELFITTLDALEACCAELERCKVFGFDTEFIGESSYHPELCLIQVATDRALYLIDPFAFENLDAFWQQVVHPAHTVVVHAGREEIRLCQIASGSAPSNIFDLQIAAGLIGLPYPMGHGNLVEALLRKRMTKGETLTEWGKRPLTSDQIQYAFDDVRHLLALYKKIKSRLQELEREEWAKEEFDRLKEISQADSAGLVPTGEKWRRLKGAGTLDRKRLAILQSIFQWREELAHRNNRPPRALLRDDLLIEIARRNPRSEKDLHVVRGLPKKHADLLMPIIEKARQTPLEDCPTLAEKDLDLPQVGLLVSALGVVLAAWGSRNHVAPNLAAAVSDLKALVRSRLERNPISDRTLLGRGWRKQHLLPVLEAFLDGKTAMRVGDMSKSMPFRLD